MTNKKREAMLECMNAMEVAMEDTMVKIQNKKDILQNNLIFWLCRSVWLLLENSVKYSVGDDTSECRNCIPE